MLHSFGGDLSIVYRSLGALISLSSLVFFKMTPTNAVIPIERIENIILPLRGTRVIIDSDLAKIYGVTTKKLNQAVKRNIHRFPHDFLFQISQKEKEEVVTICDHLSSLKFSPYLPFVFTEHGAIMAASVLNSQRAIEVSV